MKIILMGNTKIKNFCSSKYTTHGVKDNPKIQEMHLQYIYHNNRIGEDIYFKNTYRRSYEKQDRTIELGQKAELATPQKQKQKHGS